MRRPPHPEPDGTDRPRSRTGGRPGDPGGSASTRDGGGELFSGFQDPARDRRDPRGDRTRSGASPVPLLPYQDEACRQDVSPHVAGDQRQDRGGRPGADRRVGEPRRPRVHDPYRDSSGGGLLLRRAAAGSRRAPRWDLGEGRGPPFRRDRLPRRDVPDDAARL